MDLLWYYQRLSKMSSAEVSWRVRRLLWQTWVKFRRKRLEKFHENNTAVVSAVLKSMDEICFYGLPEVKPSELPQEWEKSTIEAADRFMQHKFRYLAIGEINLGEEINWNHEYRRDIDTPLLFGPWMDYRDYESYGDFKYFWELPRLQHLMTLAKAYYLTNEDNYAQEVTKQIKSFVQQSPYLLGVNWIMPMEAAIRLVSVSWITAFLRDYLKKDAEACGLIGQIIQSHVNYVVRNYAAYSSANNHLVAEAAGVFIASVCFSQLEKIDTHREKAYNILCREISRQHYSDGVNKEQAIHYQIFAFGFFLLAGLLARANNIDFPCQYWEMLEKSANFVSAIADDNCLVPNIGDSDSGKAVLLSETDCNPVQSILATSAVLFERCDFKEKAKTFDEVSFWLLGNKGKHEFDALAAESFSGTNRFDRGGYYILSSNSATKAKVIFDCGPLGFESIAAHGHADSLSFVLSAYGRPYFIDPGTYTYIADSPFRSYFRSTAAHNTVVVDDHDQSQQTGPFLWGHKANSYLVQRANDEHYDKITGWHDGYSRLYDPVIHRRTVEINKDKETIEIKDVMEAKASHKISIYFHLSPQCQVDGREAKQWYITNNNRTILLETDNNLKCEHIRACNKPIGGWASSAYDQKEPIDTLVCRGLFTGRQEFTTKINMLVS